jgi:hypothetical protein
MSILFIICTIIGVLTLIYFVVTAIMAGTFLIWDAIKKLLIGLLILLIVFLAIRGLMTL